MGGNKNGINMEATGVCYMVLLRGCPHLVVRVEYGNYVYFPHQLHVRQFAASVLIILLTC